MENSLTQRNNEKYFVDNTGRKYYYRRHSVQYTLKNIFEGPREENTIRRTHTETGLSQTTEESNAQVVIVNKSQKKGQENIEEIQSKLTKVDDIDLIWGYYITRAREHKVKEQ
jgi:spore germination protein GerM